MFCDRLGLLLPWLPASLFRFCVETFPPCFFFAPPEVRCAGTTKLSPIPSGLEHATPSLGPCATQLLASLKLIMHQYVKDAWRVFLHGLSSASASFCPRDVVCF